MSKFDFDKWFKNNCIFDYELLDETEVNLIKDTAKACSEHYEKREAENIALIDKEIKLIKKYETESKKLHSMRGMSSHLDKLEHILKGLQKARDIIKDGNDE
jgi:hypothetical protein